jgi:hypothetical protein
LNNENDTIDVFEENTYKLENLRYNFRKLSKKCLKEIEEDY